MSKTFRTQGAGSSQTLHEIEDEKIPVYDTKAEADADLANLAEGQIVTTKDTSNDYESELYNYVDAKLATTEVDVPITGVSLTCKARKSGNTVEVQLIPTGSDLSVPYAATTAIGTLPEGYRPARLEEFTIGARVVSSTSDMATYPPRVTFQTNGTISIRDWNPSADVILNSPYNSYTFLVDGSNNNFMSVNTLKDAKDYTDARAVRKFNYTMTGTDNVYEDIKALCGQLIGLGVNTYAGTFLRSGRTYGYYSITVTAADGSILNGTVVIDNEQGRTNSYTVSKVNNNWNIMPAMLNNNIHATDCNLVINPGIYNIDTSTANTPYAGIYGILETKGWNPDIPSGGAQWIYQEVLDNYGRKYVRQCINPNTLAPISSQWTTWEEEDVYTYNIIIPAPASTVVGYLSQIKYVLNQADWTKVNNSGGKRSFVGCLEFSGYWYGTYNLTHTGNSYKIINGTIYGEGVPVRFSGWYDPNYGWKVSLSYNYTYVDIRGQQYINDLNQQLSTALNLVAPQTWDVQHCDCNIEVLGYFYAMGTYDRRGAYASFSGTILSSNPTVNGQTFTAEFETTRNYWVCHNIILKNTGAVTIDGNSNVYLGGITGTNDCEIIAVRCTDHDIPVIPAKNTAGQWYARATNWNGSSAAGSNVTLEVQFRLL